MTLSNESSFEKLEKRDKKLDKLYIISMILVTLLILALSIGLNILKH